MDGNTDRQTDIKKNGKKEGGIDARKNDFIK